MKTMTYTESRAHYAEVLDSVVDDCEEVVIVRAGHEPAVIVPSPSTSRSRRRTISCATRSTPGACSAPPGGSRPVVVPLTISLRTRTTDMGLVWDDGAWEEYLRWQTQDRRILKRINRLLRNIQRNGNTGIGRPEPLRYNLAGYWSRRITEEHRLVYRIDEHGNILIASCRQHYEDR